MSRYELRPKATCQSVTRATVGWDRPLQTYFAQVFFRTAEEPEEGEPLIWRGTEPGELLAAEAAISIVAPHADIPDDLEAQLVADMNAASGVKDGPHQAVAKRYLFGSTH